MRRGGQGPPPSEWGASVARCPPNRAYLTRLGSECQRCRWQLCVWPGNGGTMPGENYPFTTRVEPVSPPYWAREADGPARKMVEAPGTAPGSATLIPSSVYRHSRQAGRPNIGALPPLLKSGWRSRARIGQTPRPQETREVAMSERRNAAPDPRADREATTAQLSAEQQARSTPCASRRRRPAARSCRRSRRCSTRRCRCSITASSA